MTEKQIKYCPNCGTQFIPPQKFCMECGQRLPQSTQETSEQQTVEETRESQPLRGQSEAHTKTYSKAQTTDTDNKQHAGKRRMSHREHRVPNDREYQRQSIHEQGYYRENETTEPVSSANSDIALWGARASVLIATVALIVGIFFKFNLFIAIIYVATFYISKYLLDHIVRVPHQEYRFYDKLWRIQKLVFTVMLVIVAVHVGIQFVMTGMRTTFSYAISNIYWPTGSVIDIARRLLQIV